MVAIFFHNLRKSFETHFKPNDGPTPLPSLPEEVAARLFSFLSATDGENLARTCRGFYSVASRPEFEILTPSRCARRELFEKLGTLIEKVCTFEANRWVTKEEGNYLFSLTMDIMAERDQIKSNQELEKLYEIFIKYAKQNAGANDQKFECYIGSANWLISRCMDSKSKKVDQEICVSRTRNMLCEFNRKVFEFRQPQQVAKPD